MAREVVVHLWCDPCLAEDQHVEGQELTLVLPDLPGSKPRVVAVCELHRKELYQPLLDLLAEHGQTVDEEGNPTGQRGPKRKRASSSPASEACPECGHVAPNRQALGSHCRSRHGKSIAELEGKELPYVCPECGLRTSRPQGLGAHRKAAHGVIGGKAEQERQDEGQGDLLAEDQAEEPAPAKRARKRAPAKTKARS